MSKREKQREEGKGRDTAREIQAEVGKGRRKKREGRGEAEIRTRKSRYRGKNRHTEEQIALQDREAAPGGQETENVQSPSMPAPTSFLPRLFSRGHLSFRPGLSQQSRELGDQGACPAVSVCPSSQTH